MDKPSVDPCPTRQPSFDPLESSHCRGVRGAPKATAALISTRITASHHPRGVPEPCRCRGDTGRQVPASLNVPCIRLRGLRFGGRARNKRTEPRDLVLSL